nr:bidirectional sugar transporter SWEET4-like [Ipomoea batatas]
MRVNRTYPTIVGWSAELARKRVREENKAGSFGRGTVLPRISKPVDIAAATSGQTDQPPVAALNIPSSSVDKVAGILQKLASTVGEFGEAMAEIGKQGAPVNVMRKTFSGLSNMLNVASTIEATATPTSSQLDDIFFGNFASLFLRISPLPTIVQIWKKKSVEQYSAAPYLASFLNCGIWAFYGIPIVHPNSLLFWTVNGSGVVSAIVYLFVFLYCSDRKKRFKVALIVLAEVVFMAAHAILVLTLAHNWKLRSVIIGTVAGLSSILMYASPLAIMESLGMGQPLANPEIFSSLVTD